MKSLSSNITLFPDADAAADHYFVVASGRRVGYLRRAKHGPGFFLMLDGKTWQNAPGARYSQEKDFKADWTYVKTKKLAILRASENL